MDGEEFGPLPTSLPGNSVYGIGPGAIEPDGTVSPALPRDRRRLAGDDPTSRLAMVSLACTAKCFVSVAT
jgi:hypothetical protein